MYERQGVGGQPPKTKAKVENLQFKSSESVQKLRIRQAFDFPATGFIPVVLGILDYSKTQEIPVVQNPENH